MYFASKEICRDCRGLLVLFLLRLNEQVMGLWSVKTTVWRPSIENLNFSVAAKIARSSLSNVREFLLMVVRRREKNAIGRLLLYVTSCTVAPTAVSEPSVVRESFEFSVR